MPWWWIAAILAAAFLLFSSVHFFAKNKRPFKRALLSMSTGFLSLVLINLFSGVTHVAVPVSLLSLLTSVIGGIPGVTLLLFLNLFV